MAYKIIDTCTGCGLCVPECPIDAISPGVPIFIIDDTCCDFEDCLAVCPVDAIVPCEYEEEPLVEGRDHDGDEQETGDSRGKSTVQVV